MSTITYFAWFTLTRTCIRSDYVSFSCAATAAAATAAALVAAAGQHP